MAFLLDKYTLLFLTDLSCLISPGFFGGFWLEIFFDIFFFVWNDVKDFVNWFFESFESPFVIICFSVE